MLGHFVSWGSRCGALIAMVVISIGCGGTKSEAPEFVSRLVPVSGTISLDGEPLEGATVIFFPDVEHPGGENASGQTDATGTYQLTTSIGGQGAQPGAVPGRYRVMISKFVMPDGSPLPPEMTEADAEADGGQQVVPSRYSNYERPTLDAEVTEGENVHDFELSSS